MSTICEELVSLARGIRFQNLPGDVIHEAGRRTLDALGCMLAGIKGDTSQQVRRMVSGCGGNQSSSIVGTADRTSCEKAALVNCTSLRFLDYMDGHPGPYPCHVCFNIPPILAVAELVGASGEQLITALVTAYEIMPRFQESAGLPSLAKRGWAGATNLEFSVPLAIAPLLDLDFEQTLNALSISISHGNALNASSFGQMPASKSIVDGIVAMNAVVATFLGKEGVSGPHEVIEGEGGFVPAVAGACDMQNLLKPVGRHKIMETYSKLFNTVKCGHTSVAASLQVLRENRLDWRDIDAVHLGLVRRDWDQQAHNSAESRARPASRDAANHSVRYGVAAALVEGELGPAQYEPEKLKSPDILTMLDRTSLYWEEAHDKHWPALNPATAKIRTKDGRAFTKTLLFAPGHPDNPLTDNDLELKFRQLARAALDTSQAEAAIAVIRKLAELPDVRTLTELVRPKST